MTPDERIAALEAEAKKERSHAMDMAVRGQLASFTFRNQACAEVAYDTIRQHTRRGVDGTYVVHGRPLAEHVKTTLNDLVGLLQPLPGEQTAQLSHFQDFDLNDITGSMSQKQKTQASQQILRALGR